jgi:hypothetical protein
MIGIIPVPMLMECPCPNDAGNDYASSNDAGNGMMLGIMPVPMLLLDLLSLLSLPGDQTDVMLRAFTP